MSRICNEMFLLGYLRVSTAGSRAHKQMFQMFIAGRKCYVVVCGLHYIYNAVIYISLFFTYRHEYRYDQIHNGR